MSTRRGPRGLSRTRGRPFDLAGRPDLYLRPARRALSAFRGYYLRLDQDVAGLGGDNHFLRHEGSGLVLFLHLGRRLQPWRQRRLHLRLRWRGREPFQPVLHRRRQSARLPVRRRRAAGQRDRRQARRQSLLCRHGQLRFPLGLRPGAADVRPHLRGRRHAAGYRRERPAARSERRHPRRRRRRLVLAVAAWPTCRSTCCTPSSRRTATTPRPSACPSAPGFDAAGRSAGQVRSARPGSSRFTLAASIGLVAAAVRGAAAAQPAAPLRRHRLSAGVQGCRRRARSAIKWTLTDASTREEIAREEQRLREVRQGTFGSSAASSRRKAYARAPARAFERQVADVQRMVQGRRRQARQGQRR